MKRPQLRFLAKLALLVTASTAFAGCGESTPSFVVAPPVAASASGTIEIQQTLLRAVTRFVTHMRFEGLTDGVRLYGPVLREKAAKIVLSDVPRNVTALRITYLAGDSAIGEAEVPIVFDSAGLALVVDPNWSDAPLPLTAFLAQSLVAVDSRPLSVITGDFNKDGHLDLATANNGSNNVSVALGRGDGTFAPAVSLPSGLSPFGITTADLDNDGHLDLVATNYGNPLASGSLSFFRGHARGVFGPAHHLEVGDGPTSVAAADLNMDGLLDLVCTNYREDTISVLLGRMAQGEHSFINLGTTPAGVHARAVAVGYIDDDDILDLAVANEGLPVQGTDEGDASIFLGRGDGTFRAMPAVKAGTNPHNVQIHDFNGDGKSDIAVANFNSHDISVSFGRGDGTFEPQTRYSTPNIPLCLSVGDFNRDGRPDLAAACSQEGVVAVLAGRGDGTFAPATVHDAGTASFFVESGDFNSDGKLDFAVANAASSDVSVLLGE